MQEHFHLSRTLLHHRIFRRILETLLLHRFQEDRSFVSAGVGEDRLAAWREELGYEIRQGRGVLAFVENISGENEVVDAKTPDIRLAPVEHGDLGFPLQVRAGVVGGEVEGGLVVIGREYFRAAGEGDDGGQPHAATQLDGALAGEVSFVEVSRKGDGARPELGPVREPLVAVEVFLVDQIVGGDGMRDAIGPVSDLDRGFGQPCTAAQMGSQSIQGSSAGGWGGYVGRAFLKLCRG